MKWNCGVSSNFHVPNDKIVSWWQALSNQWLNNLKVIWLQRISVKYEMKFNIYLDILNTHFQI